MEVENPDANLLKYMISLPKEELLSLLKECDNVIKDVIKDNKQNKKNNSLCEFLFDY